MRNQVTLRLSSISTEIAGTQAELSRLRDRLAAQGGELDERRLRMLMAETPLADLDLRIAVDDYRRIEKQVHRVEANLAALLEEEHRFRTFLQRASTGA